MRVFTCILLLVTLLVGAFLGYCYYGTQMKIVGVAASVTPANEALGTYNEVRQQVSDGVFLGTKYRLDEFAAAEDYEFLTLTVRMENAGFLPMDWVRIEVAPGASDVLQLAATRTPSLAGNTRSDFSTTLLTRTGGGTARKITVSYYVLGRAFSVVFSQ